MKKNYIFYIEFPHKPPFRRKDIVIANGNRVSKVLVIRVYYKDNYWKKFLRKLGIKTYINTCKCKIINNGEKK